MINYLKCPFLVCGQISGFDLPKEVRKLNEKYICQGCAKMINLKKYKKSNERDFKYQEVNKK